MALKKDFHKLCPIFNWEYNDGGVLFPYFPLSLGQAASNIAYINFDGTASVIHARFQLPFKARLITCEAWAVSDDQGLKGGAASAEPVLAINYGTDGLASIDAGTQIAVITCDGAGAIGTRWSGTTTPTTIETTQELVLHLKTAAASGTSTNQDGGASVVLWFAQCNSPA